MVLCRTSQKYLSFEGCHLFYSKWCPHSPRGLWNPLPFLMQNLRIACDGELLSNVLETYLHQRGLIFQYCLFVWSFPFSHLDFYVLRPILGLWMAKSSMPLCSNQYIRVCWLNSNNFRALAKKVHSKAFAFTIHV